ncbi:MAG: bifunctional (p)ppGpp synthetase/guanosine-3',5'-bis(diphosphate) 3'-pyrophosphohydrolase [Ignavibacteriae bacterium]|nr:bifunctional (p)ppGpp synthetase/guanosine-3',5'-bis(diphosphate) 3'-pyrophosphohydrolase [Ignavibacteriota bacterium]
MTARKPGASSANHKEMLEALLTVCTSNMRTVDTDLISRAFYTAEAAHEGQARHSGEEYFTHPVAVAMIVAQEIPVDDVTVAAALLHDVIEDCETCTYDSIQAEFGSNVADIVDGATKISNILQSREVTKAENYRKLLVSMLNDVRVILVKFADRLHNMRTLEYMNADKQKRIARETLEIYAPLAHRFGLGRLKWEFEDLAFKYLYEEPYRKLKDQLSTKRRDREDYLTRVMRPIRAELEKNGLKAEVSGRPKHMWSIYNKMLKQNKTLDEIYDLFAVRIILDSESEKGCYLAYAIVCELFTPIPERYKNFIALPKTNGYKSIHTTVLGPEGKMVEVQIRTRQMHDIAERGIAAHWAYKESVKYKQSAFENWGTWVREILEAAPAGGEEDSAELLIDGFKRNLYQEEIVVFTPKGDLIVLPTGATPVDFAFAIHSEVGIHCIGAKVNQRIVPLNRRLRSGDQVEVITSRNQYLSPDWEQSVVTQRAKKDIRRFISEQGKIRQQKGREKWDRKIKRLRLDIHDDELHRAAVRLGFSSPGKLFIALGNDELTADDILRTIDESRPKDVDITLPTADRAQVFEQYAQAAREEQGILIQGQTGNIQFDFARCCSPLPGDEVVGFVTQGRGIKIHRSNCRNILRLLSDGDTSTQSMRDRLIEISWPLTPTGEYLGGIRMEGDDRPGVLNEIALAISSYNNTNIRSVNIEALPGTSSFHGSVLVTVRDLDHLQRLIERVKKVRGVSIAERYVDVA